MKPRAAAAVGVRDDDPSLTGQLHDLFAPELRHPPVEWFFEPPDWFDDETKVWADSDGRVAGWFYQAGVCIIDGNEGDCWMPTPSPTGNELFHQGSVIALDDGTPTILDIGVIGGGGDHAPTWMSIEQAVTYYADVNRQLMIGRAYDNPNKGGYFLGAILPRVTVEQVDMIRRSALSGDWRYRRRDLAGHALGGYDCLGPWLVTRPGLPVHRTGRTVTRIAAPKGPPVYVGGVHSAPEAPRYAPSMWHIEHRAGTFAVVESRTGNDLTIHATIEQANTHLASLHEPRAAAVVGATDLPIAGRDVPWDGPGAVQRVQEWASSDGAINFDRYARAFLYRDDDADPATVGAYKLGFADIIDGELTTVPRGVFAVAGVLSGARGGADIPAAEQDRIRARVSAFYRDLSEKFDDPELVPPWDPATNQGAPMTDAATPPPEAPEPEIAAPDAETAARIDGLEQRVADLEAALSELMADGLTVEEIMPAEMLPGA